jgi:hypothetical protein
LVYQGSLYGHGCCHDADHGDQLDTCQQSHIHPVLGNVNLQAAFYRYDR